MTEDTEDRTPTMILMEIAQEFSKADPKAFIAVWTDENEDIVLKSNVSRSQAVGLLEYGKHWILDEAPFRT